MSRLHAVLPPDSVRRVRLANGLTVLARRDATAPVVAIVTWVKAGYFDEPDDVVGIAQTGSDISPCNRHHLELAKRVREGIRDAGGIALEFPVHPIQETGKRPTAGLDRNLAYLGLV